VRIGYARVSTESQNLDMQLKALKAAGCEKIYTDTASGVLHAREGLTEALNQVKVGDTLFVWKLDRLGRSLQNLIENINYLKAKGVGFSSLQENLDTTSPSGVLIFNIFGALAQFERELISMRTKAGLAAARERKAFGGRPPKMNGKKIETARRLLRDPSMTVEEVCLALQVSKATLYRHLARLEKESI